MLEDPIEYTHKSIKYLIIQKEVGEGKDCIIFGEGKIISLREVCDILIVGEVRGKEAFDMMQAMNTGHEGSITTLHANNPVDAINRLETMILMNEMEIPVSAVRGYIENAIDIVVQIDRLQDGRRKISSISEVDGLEDGNVNIRQIFSYKQSGVMDDGTVEGEFKISRGVPRVYDKIKRKGIDRLDKTFKK